MTAETPKSAEESENRLSPAASLPGSSAKERESIERRSRPSAALIHETIRAEGESELERSIWALILSGTAAGLSMGFSLVAQGLIEAHLPATSWRELVSKLGYTIGFLVVVMGRQQLFTENTLTPILPLLYHRDLATLRDVLRLWGLVLAANILATWAFAAVVAHTGVFAPDVRAAFDAISRASMASPFSVTFVGAVFAGWLIALMVWLLPAADAARPFIIMIMSYVIALGSFSHVIAGSVDAFYQVEAAKASLGDYAWRFFLPTLLGNVLGGVALVAVLNYGQVAPEIEE